MTTFSTPSKARRRISFAGMCLVLLVLFGTTPAWSVPEPTQFEFYAWPGYCKARLANTSSYRLKGLTINEEEIAYWKKVTPNFVDMHHYCWGLLYLSRAQEPGNMANAQGLFRSAAKQIDYVRSRSNESSPLWGEITLKYARAQEGMGQRDVAIRLLEELRALHRDNAHTYVALAQTLERGQKLDEAVAVLEEGLKVAKPKGPILFWLARYHYDAGNAERAAELLPLAEKEGMKMDSLRERLDASAAARPGTSARFPAIPAVNTD